MLLSLPVSVRHAVGVGRVEPITTAVPVFPENVLSAIEPSRSVYCSISRPEAAFDDMFSQLAIVFSEILNVNELIPVGA